MTKEERSSSNSPNFGANCFEFSRPKKEFTRVTQLAIEEE